MIKSNRNHPLNRFERFLNRNIKSFKKTLQKKRTSFLKKLSVSVALISLIIVSTVINRFVLSKNLDNMVIVVFLASFLTFSHVDEHYILAIAMFLCLYFSYDTVCTLIKGEIKSRNEQIYKLLQSGLENEISSLNHRKNELKELKTITLDLIDIKNNILNSLKKRSSKKNNFTISTFVEKGLKICVFEEIAYLQLLEENRKKFLENSNKNFDSLEEFSDSKIQELINS